MKAKLILTVFLLLGIVADASFAQLQLNGAGATFPNVIYSKWFDVYKNLTGVQFNYQAIGSGGGIRQVTEGTVDFGASDGPMSDEQLAAVKEKQGVDVLHIPTVMGGIVLSYNLPSVSQKLKFDGSIIADIFLGKITKWNDSKLKEINPGVDLPDKAILVAHRSDGSGTTFIFTNYLCKVSSEWKEKVGNNTSVNWPIGLGGKGNDGVAGLVKQTEGSIGYVELAYAVQNKLPYGSLKNKAGNFVDANFNTVTAAAASAIKNMPEDLRAIITDSDGKDAYPISGFTWLLVYKNMKDASKAAALVKFLKWAMEKGESYASDLYYAPLPKQVIKLCEKKIALITANGKKIK
jgi:phosphate transport system substrate-binding protein